MRRLICFGRAQRGQAAVSGFFLVLLFIMVVAALVDVYNLMTVRSWAYRAAEDAALHGAAAGRDWAYLTSSGEIRLMSGVAQAAALDAVNRELAARGLTATTIDIRVISGPGGGTIAGYPSVARASVFDESDWTEVDPAVGVYLVISVPTTFFGLVNGGGALDVHVFAAAAVS